MVKEIQPMDSLHVSSLFTLHSQCEYQGRRDPIPIGVEICACYHHPNTYQYKCSVDVNILKWAFLLPRDIREDNGTHLSVIMSEGDFSERDRQALERLQNHLWMASVAQEGAESLASVAQGEAERFGELTLVMTNPDKKYEMKELRMLCE